MNGRIHRCLCFWVIGLIAVWCQLRVTAQEWAWAKRCGGQGAERSMGIALDPQSNVYAAGWFEGTAFFATQTLTVTGQRDVFVGKWESNGNLVWVQKGGGKDEDYASAITVDMHGNPILLGAFRSATAEFGGLVVSNKYARDYDSLFIAKLDPSGKGTWVQQVGGASTGGAAGEMASIKTDAYGNIYLFLSGQFRASTTVGSVALANSTAQRTFLSKWDMDGQSLWVRQAGGENTQIASPGIPDSSIYVTGQFSDPSASNTTWLLSAGNSDLFLARLDPDAPAATPSKPVILEPPQGVSADRGSSVQLAVQIAGTSPVAYQWRKQGVALGNYNRVLGSTTARLSINTIQTNDAGNYTVVITNNYGSVTSVVAVVTVGPASPASGPLWSWVQTLGGSGSDLTSGLTTDGSGNVYVTGTFQKTNVIGGATRDTPCGRSGFRTLPSVGHSARDQWASRDNCDRRGRLGISIVHWMAAPV